MPSLHAPSTTRPTKFKLTAIFCIEADDFNAVPSGKLKQTYALRKERLFDAYKLPAPRVTRIQAFFGADVDKSPQLTCEWVDTEVCVLAVSFARWRCRAMHSWPVTVR